jgi:tetratricopeptide (TPR) repeat protein
MAEGSPQMRPANVIASACVAAVLALLSAPALPAFDADPLEDLATRNIDFQRGRAAIEAKDWNSAIQSLTAADQRTPGNADIHNLLGYAYRNAGKLEVALDHYQKALKIDPRHRGAHEYIGEAYLMAGDLAKAEEHLGVLRRICPIRCEEREDLSRRIAAYKAGRK